MIYFTADLHFSHENIIESCNRGFKNKDRMNNHIINKYNSVVTEKDICFIIGDISLSSPKRELKDLMSRMNGTKILIAGNHDTLSVYDYLDIGFKDVYSSLELKSGDVIEGLPIISDMILCHDPNRIKNKNNFVVCGHVHNMFKYFTSEKMNTSFLNVGVDVWEYLPQPLSKIQLMFSKLKNINNYCYFKTDNIIKLLNLADTDFINKINPNLSNEKYSKLKLSEVSDLLLHISEKEHGYYFNKNEDAQTLLLVINELYNSIILDCLDLSSLGEGTE